MGQTGMWDIWAAHSYVLCKSLYLICLAVTRGLVPKEL